MSVRPELFATHLSIENFRGYGRLDLEIPPGPCAILLSGPNGLGKTSLFEAIEWGLTGTVKRLDEVAGGRIDARELLRKGSGADRFEVRLAFRDRVGKEERVTRTQIIPATGAPGNSLGTDVASVADLLRSDESRWSVGSTNISDYLHLTHLHAQVARLRLVTFNAKQRWVRVSPLAGAERFERVRLNLTNAKGAMSRLRDEREKELSFALERERTWSEKVARFSQLQDLRAAAGQIISPGEVLNRVYDLSLRHGIPVAGLQSVTEVTLVDAIGTIREFRIALEAAQRADQDRSLTIQGLRATPSQYAAAQAERDAIAPTIAKLEAERTDVSAQLQSYTESVGRLRAASDEAQRVRDRASARHALVTAAVRDRADVRRVEGELAEAEAAFTAAQGALEEADVGLRRKREEVEAYDARIRTREEVRGHLVATTAAIRALDERGATRRAFEAEEARNRLLSESLHDVQQRRSAVATELAGKTELLASVQEEFASVRSLTERLQQAVVVVAEHVAHEDTACPVCRTTFEPGRLRSLARESLGVVEPRIREFEGRITALREEQDALRKRELALKADERKADADARNSSESLSQLGKRISELNAHPLIAGRPEPEGTAHVTALRTQQSGELARLDREIAEIDTDRLRQAHLDLSVTGEKLRSDRAAAHERRNARQTRLEEVHARISQRHAEQPDLDTTEQRLGLLLQAAASGAALASEAADNAAAALANARAAEENAMRVLATTKEREDEALRRQQSSAASMTAMRERWIASSLPEPIVDTVLDSTNESIAQRQRSRDGALRNLNELSGALERWKGTSDLQALDLELRSEQGMAQREEHTKHLGAAVLQAQAAFETAKRARDASDELSDALQRVATDYGERALRPFDALFRRYLRALVHDERFHGIQATYKGGGARSASLRFRVDLAGSDTDAELILSEGQLGEVSLAAMLAASATFPWSRWRALLLDDPTQYNDLIHATALIDVLRNLVRRAGYQVIVSTHDGEQAAFLKRKFDAVGVPWIDCRYTGLGPDGPLISVTSRLEQPQVATAS